MARGSDAPGEAESDRRSNLQSFRLALGLLTVLPVGLRDLPPPAAVGRARFWFPPVGVFLGVLLGGLTFLAGHLSVGPLLQGFMVLLAWVVLTGALHLDGFCDLCDGLFAGRTAEDRLRILKDPHLGTFGLAGGVLLLLGKLLVLAEVIGRLGAEAAWPVAGTVAAARCFVLCLAAGARYPRPEGTGKALVEATAAREAGLFAGLAAACLILVAPSPVLLAVSVVFLAAAAVLLALRWLCQRRLGGITGDCLGAGIEALEFVILLTWLLLEAAGE
jgi:adenosylcobinamide-GDP ribazoletransferase